MAVSIMRPEQRESGVDTFLRRLGSVANVANAGINTYSGYKDLQAKSQAKDDANKGIYGGKELDPKDWVDAQEGEAGAQSFKVRGEDGNVSDKFKRRYVTQEKAKSAEEIANTEADTSYKKAQAWALRNKPSEAEARIQAKAEEKALSANEKKMASMNEVEDRRRNIEDNLNLVEDSIKKDGTYEMFGSHNADLDRRVDMIATDMAKLSDPSSVARPSEVEMFKKGLVQSGAFQRDGTALDLIKNFRSEVNKRADNAYEVRGLSNLVKSKSPKEPKEFAGMSTDDIKKAYDAKKAADAKANQMRTR